MLVGVSLRVMEGLCVCLFFLVLFGVSYLSFALVVVLLFFLFKLWGEPCVVRFVWGYACLVCQGCSYFNALGIKKHCEQTKRLG